MRQRVHGGNHISKRNTDSIGSSPPPHDSAARSWSATNFVPFAVIRHSLYSSLGNPCSATSPPQLFSRLHPWKPAPRWTEFLLFLPPRHPESITRGRSSCLESIHYVWVSAPCGSAESDLPPYCPGTVLALDRGLNDPVGRVRRSRKCVLLLSLLSLVFPEPAGFDDCGIHLVLIQRCDFQSLCGPFSTPINNYGVPLLAWLANMLVRKRSKRMLFLFALAYAFIVFSGYIFFVYTVTLYLLLVTLITNWTHPCDVNGFRARWTPIVRLGFGISLGLALSAIQLFPTFQLLENATRSTSADSFTSTFSFPPENFLAFVWPHFFGWDIKPTGYYYWGRDYYWEMVQYVGILPLILALCGFLVVNRPMKIAFSITTLLSVLLAVGNATPFFAVATAALPFASSFRGPSKWMVIVIFNLATLAAYGADYWIKNCGNGRRSVSFKAKSSRISCRCFLKNAKTFQRRFSPECFSHPVWFSTAPCYICQWSIG